MENITWIFDGIGSTIISLIGGIIIGGFAGYKIGIHQKIRQYQKAGNNSHLAQTGTINNYGKK